MNKGSAGMSNSSRFQMEIDPELDKQVLDKKKIYESVRTPGYRVKISEIEDSYVVFYEKASPDKEAQKIPIYLFKQLYKEVV